MFCFSVKRKLYDLLEGNLTGSAAEKIKVHLQSCSNCAQEYKEMKQVLGLVAQKKASQPSSQFWANFDQELDEKLAKERILPQEFKLRPHYLPRVSLKPAFTFVTVFIVLIVMSIYLFGGLPTKGRLSALADDSLVKDIEVIEELSDEFVVLDDTNSLLDEITLLEELS